VLTTFERVTLCLFGESKQSVTTTNVESLYPFLSRQPEKVLASNLCEPAFQRVQRLFELRDFRLGHVACGDIPSYLLEKLIAFLNEFTLLLLQILFE
jgi:hypothetical protein